MIRSIGFTFGRQLLTAVILPALAIAQTGAPSKPDNGATVAALASAPAAQDAPAKSARPDETFIIGDDDVLAISVWKEPDLTKQLPVRSDGNILTPSYR